MSNSEKTDIKEKNMYYAVKLDKSGNVEEKLNQEFDDARSCFMAARKAYGIYGRLQFKKSKLLLN